MQLTNHPEHVTYLRDQETAQRCRRGLSTWEASGDSIVVKAYSLCWTFESGQEFARSLSHVFQEYNRVLWEQFPYCRQCDGKCCVPGAPDVKPFDTIALALLGYSQPLLSDEIEATARDCIYHTAKGCLWPEEWRPIKCWSFFCALDERYIAISEELKRVVLNLLPDPLRKYETARGDHLATYLVDPIGFAGAIHKALVNVFVTPLNSYYLIVKKKPSYDNSENVDGQGNDNVTYNSRGPNGTAVEPPQNSISNVIANVLTFIMEAVEQIRESPSSAPKEFDVPPEQLLADLESLEWIVVGLPEQGPKLLDELYHRYAPATTLGKKRHITICRRMCYHILRLRNSWNQLAPTQRGEK